MDQRVQTRFLRGWICLSLNDNEQAIAFFRQAVDAVPTIARRYDPAWDKAKQKPDATATYVFKAMDLIQQLTGVK